MTMPLGFFTVLILAALVLVCIAPIVLLTLWARDRRKGELW